jgi:NADH-quinone oxidoreductase subunit E
LILLIRTHSHFDFASCAPIKAVYTHYQENNQALKVYFNTVSMTAVTTHGGTFEISAATKAEIKVITTFFPEGKHKSAIIRALHLVQEDNEGWLSVASMDALAKELSITNIEVYEVATFYSMFNLAPVGKYVLEFCHTGPCAIEGAESLIKYAQQKLGIETGQTTIDKMFTIKEVECLGACGYAPMMQVGQYFHEHLTEAKFDQFVMDCHAGKIDKGSWKM